MSGRIVHFEIPADDVARARSFYADAFGWTMMPMPEMEYTMVQTGPGTEQGMPAEPGFINGGMMHRQEPLTHPIVTVDVEDIDAALRKVEELGGKTLLGRQPVGDMGFAAYFTDTEGNTVGLWQLARPSS
ncbi:VOC family protein [Actinocatenispora rupis]|uniref:Glyoxalase n=1 Tax=Actinocatenispora rupis TaxID=519421 RepID=A0A8J3N973_9ACTN|nr:VOC family protein [Actinocatenispora rupis]GID10836.1 glyoxalase [Actinocatenispora rupis]